MVQKRQWTAGELEREVIRCGFEIVPGGRHAHHVVRIDPETGRRGFIGCLPGHRGKNVPIGTARDLINRLRQAMMEERS